MKQVLQNLQSGETLLADVPCPMASPENLLIRTHISLVSIGTERMLIEFCRASLIEKARQQPEKVRQVFQKIKTDGFLPAIQAVRSKFDRPIALGYSNVGEVLEVPNKNLGFRVGDRVVSNGPHAEVVSVPKNLCARIPDSVSNVEAAFAVVGAISLQGVRLVQPSLGEAVVVTGLGLIGLLAVQFLRAHGCRVLGIDFDSSKCALARHFGAKTVDLSKGEDPISSATLFSKGRGIDAVLIAASTRSNDPIHQAALMCRKRGRIVLVGVVGLELSRADFYEKELSFQVSCSYGPGRYDEDYEVKGNDYPFGLVRWTEQRNFEAVLDMMAEKRVDLMPLISHRFLFEDALKAYEAIGDNKALGLLLEYGANPQHVPPHIPKPADFSIVERTIRLAPQAEKDESKAHVAVKPPTVGVIGAGDFTGLILLPALNRNEVRFKTIASAVGVTGTHLGKKFGFEISTTDTVSIFADEEIDTVIVSTRHNYHARFVIEGLRSGKHVYVEKPLCLTEGELHEITACYNEIAGRRTPFLMVGFNRRFAPQIVRIKELLGTLREPKTLVMTVNAGAIPPNHWTQKPNEGGGRIIGEGCHFIDLLRHLTAAPILSAHAAQLGAASGATVPEDKVTLTLTFGDGSIGTVHYFANGHKSFPKERLEVFCGGRVLQLDNFIRLTGFGWPSFKKMNLWRQDKGHSAEMAALIASIRDDKPSPIPFEELAEVARVAIDLADHGSYERAGKPKFGPAEIQA